MKCSLHGQKSAKIIKRIKDAHVVSVTISSEKDEISAGFNQLNFLPKKIIFVYELIVTKSSHDEIPGKRVKLDNN